MAAANSSTATKAKSDEKSTSSRRKNVPKTKADKEKIRQRKIEDVNEYKDRVAFETTVVLIVMIIFAIFLYLGYFGLGGIVGRIFGGLSFGIFGWSAWILPVGVIIGYVFVLANRGDRRVPRKLLSFISAIWLLLGISDLLFKQEIISEYYTSNHVLHKNYFECMNLTFEDVLNGGKGNAGIVGRLLGTVFSKITGETAAVVIMIALFVLCLFIFYGIELMAALRKRNTYKEEMENIYEEISRKEDYRAPSYRVTPPPVQKRQQRYNSGAIMQSVNLTEMNQTLDRMEASTYNKALDKSALEEIIADSDAGKVEVKKNSKKEISNLNNKIYDKIPVKNSSNIQQKTKPYESDEKRRKKDLESIPVFRDELDKKFGKKKSFVQDNTPKPLFPYRDKIKAETEIEEESVPTIKDIKLEPEPKNDIDEIISVHNMHLMDIDSKNNDVIDENIIEEETVENNIKDTKKDIVEDIIKSSIEDKIEEITKEESLPEKVVVKEIVEDTPKEVSKVTPEVSYKKPEKTIDHVVTEEPVQRREYVFPPVGLLSTPKAPLNSMSDDELRSVALKLQDTLKSFNVNVRMGAVTCGPTVTRYELFPEQGVRVNKITNLSDDLKLSLAAQSIRIEAPIPGKSAVGIEVPNTEPGSVTFRELLETETFQNAKSPVTFAVGKDIGGNPVMTDIAKMPHLLIAGATGSGKSVCINTLIMSILYKANPDDVKLIMIDPKVVELSVYNGIPHLFCPVVTDPKEASAALNWAVREMMDRYNKFTELGVRNITGYNKKIKTVPEPEKAGYTKMPSLVIIVDEFADLMMVASKEVEDSVCRLAQLARAAGIHLVLATQRPSVNVITGVIKANIPSRIAFSVSSAVDSRTIIDKSGAEKLVGKGDMLFFPSGYSEPVRVQGAFVSDKEVSDVVEFLRDNNDIPEYNENVTEIVETETATETTGKEQTKTDRDEYFEDAGRFVIESERAAAGQLQRRFSIGFNRAGRIIDQLHKAGVVGPAEGTKPRKILMTMNDFDLLLGKVPPVSDEEIEETMQNYSGAGGGNEQYEQF